MKIKILLISFCFFIICGITSAQKTQLYGYSARGGDTNNGTIVRMNMDGTGFAKVYDFVDSTGTVPLGEPIQVGNKLYGVCEEGGRDSSCTIFSFDPTTGEFVDLHDFLTSTGDQPTSELIEGPNGTLVGVATEGGLGSGVIYSFDPANNSYSVLYIFPIDTLYKYNGIRPVYSRPFLTSNGILYGMTCDWQGTNSVNGLPANTGRNIYSYDFSSGVYTNLFHFNDTSGISPHGGFIQLTDGVLYGMSALGGKHNFGTIFAFNIYDNDFIVVHDFDSITGATPMSYLMQAKDGKLYGTTSAGGAYNDGVLFKFDPTSNSYTDIFNFDSVNGAYPFGNLMQSNDGKLYGNVAGGGEFGMGVAFNFDLTNNSYSILAEFADTNGAYPQGGFGVFNPTLGIAVSHVVETEDLFVYPVPAKQFLNSNVQLPFNTKAELRLTDITGREVFNQQIEAIDTKQNFTIDMSHFNPGLYLFELISGNKKFTRKIIKE